MAANGCISLDGELIMFLRMLLGVLLVAASTVVSAQQSRTAELEAEAQRLATAALRETDMARKVETLTALARIYDVENLNNLPLLELTLRDLIAIRPNDASLLFRLALVQEDQGSIDAAEQTLLWARQQHASNPDVYRRLSDFYGRRTTGVRNATFATQADDTGVYQVGGSIAMPRRIGGIRRPELPRAAAQAGVLGGVMVEFTVTETGTVTDARVVNSIPLLDDTALDTVRGWRFTPTMFEGRPVRVRLNTTIAFR
jgi:TonB family protein